MAKKRVEQAVLKQEQNRADPLAFDEPPCNQIRTATGRGPTEAAAKAAAKKIAAQYQCNLDGCKKRTEWVSNVTDNQGGNPRWQATVSVQCTA